MFKYRCLHKFWQMCVNKMICSSVNDRLASLNMHLQMWAQLESRLDELQSDLRSDEETLQLLDSALKGGFVSVDIASSVRDVAKVLSESHVGAQVIINL